jgi:uncharacterized protein YqjF (DUF2071 family)
MLKTFLTAEWRKLAIANYSVDPGLLIPFLPYKTELDFWNNKCYVSLVGFRFINTRIKGIMVPFHRDFEEINLRFYVRYKEGNSWKRGVTFIKEIVPKPGLSLVANYLYNEKYVTMPTRHKWAGDNGSIDIRYEWKHKGTWDLMEFKAASASENIPVGSEEEFITEHYWGYTVLGNTLTSQYQVEHPRWQTYPVISHKINARFGDLYGLEFAGLANTMPDSVMLAEGSEIAVRVADKIKK